MAELPDGLGPLIDVGIRKSPFGNLDRDWYTTYQVQKVGGDFAHEDVNPLVAALIDAEQAIHHPVVYFHGGYGRRYVAKTIEPNPDPHTFNPSNHVPVTANDTGALDPGAGAELYVDQIYDIIRTGAYGNPGRIEIRGGLTENDVNPTLANRAFTDVSGFNTRTAAFWAALQAIQTDLGVVFVLAGEPRISIVRSVVDNRNKAVKTYGETNIRPITSMALGSLRTDRGRARWHNNPS